MVKVEPLDKEKKKQQNVFLDVLFDHQAFMAHIVWYSENMEEKTAQFHSKAQTEQKWDQWDLYKHSRYHKML